jgi:hypothetical protein
MKMKKFISRYFPEELIRVLQTVYWSLRLLRFFQEW